MREIKFEYIFKKKFNNEIIKKQRDIELLEELEMDIICLEMGAEIIARRQYTGLKDKNGKEIFEGDVVNCSSGCPHKVIYIEEYGGTFGGGMPCFYLEGLKPGYSWMGTEELVGNIYENPNLL